MSIVAEQSFPIIHSMFYQCWLIGTNLGEGSHEPKQRCADLSRAPLASGLIECRILVATSDAADSAGAYWAWTKAAAYANEQPIMKRDENPVESGVKVYYS